MRLSYEFVNILGAVYHRGSIKFGPDGSSVYSPVGNKVVVYDLKGNKSNALPLQLNYNIDQLSIHPKGTLMLASSEKTHLYLISLMSGRLLHLKEYKTFSKITHISFSPDGYYYCVCGDSTTLIYITPGSLIAGKGREIIPFRLLKKYRVSYGEISAVSWSKDSNYLCVGSQDLTVNVISLLDQGKNVVTLRGHTDALIGCYFANKDSSDRQLYSLSKNCQLFIWDEKERNEESEDEKNQPGEENDDNLVGKSTKKMRRSLQFHRSAKHYLKLAPEPEESKESKLKRNSAYITSADYNSNARILVVGYNTGNYCLYEMPNATLIHEHDSNSGSISSLSINNTGDWIAFGSSIDPETDRGNSDNKTESRLLVWEWQSKSHILDQTGTGATISNMHECLSYSLDGSHIVSGNLSGRIKVWSGLTGETIACFGEEHKGPIKAIKFAPNKSGKVIISASVDGTLRAYDLHKFKNFRTFKSPVDEKRPEFICMDIDSTGEFIAAGTYNYFEVYLYSLQTGKFLEYLTGHEGPVTGLAFSPTSNILVSTSWDCTAKIWNLFEGSKCMRDTIVMSHEIITVAFRPDGTQFAVSLSNGQIATFNPHSSDQLGAPIEGAADLGTTHLLTEISRESKKYFSTLNYSADGTYLIAGGMSNHICIYHAEEKMLMKKIALTFNLSMDGVFDYISSRRRKEFGFNLELIQTRKEERTARPIKLPGVRKGDLGERDAKVVIAINQIVFSPTMRSFSAATTEGVLIYSLDVNRNFDPYRLAIEVDPDSVRQAMRSRDYGTALIQVMQLNDKKLLKQVIENIPPGEIDIISANMELNYVRRLLTFISNLIRDTVHIEFYMLWVKKLLYKHGIALKNQKSNDTTPIMRGLHQNIHRHYVDVKKNCDYCKYSLEYLTRERKKQSESDEDKDEDDELDEEHQVADEMEIGDEDLSA